ncbi:unnamed protein product [Rotaria magnacalcarata]|uniref:MSP domain-containing protein n=1 Tax=Rotaria magnacalcarata TaxID=392030 RepID=A0A8S2NJD6_9BILA|nr:unnamed protein product [Rotaria magnacalcarata]
MPGLIRLKQPGLSPVQLTNDTTQTLIYRNPNARITWDGIETYKRCIFRNWIPGEEYTEVLTFKNLSGKNVTFTYEVPKTQYFQTIYPRRLTLSQGVTFSLPIQFSPLEKIAYIDELVVYINQTPRRIALAGLLPQYRLSLEPKELDFGYCAIQDIQIRSFKLRNTGDLETSIEWHTSEPFSIEPRDCILPVGGMQAFTCSFQPQWALIYVGTASCIYGNQSVCELRLHGVGKFPHVIVRSDDGAMNENTGNTLICFGDMPINGLLKRELILINQSTFRVPFRIESLPGVAKFDSAFRFGKTEGIIEAGKRQTIPVKFQPKTCEQYYRDFFNVSTQQGNLVTAVVECSGKAMGNIIKINYQKITFGQVLALVLKRQNHSFYILTNNCDYLKRGRLVLDGHGSIMETEDTSLINDIKFIKDEHDYIIPPLSNPLKENYLYWFSNEDNTRFEYVTLSETSFIFDQCSLDSTSEWQQSLTITNLTRGKLTLVWFTADSSVFSISPIEAEILPLKSTAFRVIFRPTVVDTFYTKHFEGYVFYKNQRDFTLVPDYGVMAPVQLDLNCVGNTLRVNHEILPICQFDRDVLIFPPIGDQTSIYQTLTLTNNGTTPIIYRFLSSNDEQTPANYFTFKPSRGYVKPGDYTIIIVRYKPIQTNGNNEIYQERIIVRLNERDKFDKVLNVFATQEKARLLIPNDGHIHALTTCIGLSSETRLQLKSLTRSQLEFNWTLDHNISSIRVEPMNGYFKPYEEKDFIITYKPKDEGKISMPAKLNCWVGDRTKQGAEIYHITIHASTRDGYLRASELHRDMGPIALGTSATYDLYITNGGDCLLRYRIYTKQTVLENKRKDNDYSMESEEVSILEFISNPNGLGEVDGKAKICVPCRIHPFSRSYYQIELSYELLDNNNQRLSDHQHHLCTLTVHGVYPHLAFMDILGTQQSAPLSKNLLSKAFNIAKINTLLAKEPTADELTYAINSPREDICSTKVNKYRKTKLENGAPSPLPPLEQPEAIIFNFNAAPINSAPSEVHLLLENCSDLDTTWSFLFPKDLQCELEYWARTGDFTEDELNEMKLQDNKIFSINPKKGTLKKGSNVTITITYKHIFAGQHTLPAIFKVGRGRQIMLNLVGISVEPGERYVQFYSTIHHLLPVELGAQGAPVQQYELWNGGTVPIHFQVDMSQLEQISSSNYGFWVLDCLTPEGTIVPNKSFVTQWVFNPLEAREYVFNIKIDLENCDPALITFTGHGFDKRDVDSDVSKSLVDNNEMTKQLNLDDRLASLTIDRINFGNLPLFTKRRHITFLKNRSNKDSISFIWHVTNPEQVRHIRIQPVRGKIQPRQSLPIKVTFMAIEAPAFHDIDLVCEIYNETTLEQYNLDLKRWETNIQKKWESFEISDDEYKECLRSGTLDDNEKQQSSTVQTQFHQGSTLQMCKTLPPVLVNYELDESNVDRTRRLRANAKRQENTRPQMPIPELLHLAFTARTLVYNEYLDLCPDTSELQKFFVDTCLGGDYGSKTSKRRSKKNEYDPLMSDEDNDEEVELTTNNNSRITVNEEEADLLRNTLSDLLRNLLSDRVFADTLPDMIAETIPYFSQLKYTQTPRNIEQQRRSQESHLLKDYQTNPDEVPMHLHDRSLASSSTDREHLAINRSELIPKAKITKRIPSTPSSMSEFDQQNLDDNEHLKNNPNITALTEDVLENTLWNILQEAYHSEFSLTARPRLIALPPKRQSSSLTRANLQGSSNQFIFPSPPLILTESFD